MTEDRFQEDELNFDDEEFIIEDLEVDGEDIFAEADLELNLTSGQAGNTGDGSGGDLVDMESDPDDFHIEGEAEEGGSPDVDDILFEALSDRSESSEFEANLGPSFSDANEANASEIAGYDFDSTVEEGVDDLSADAFEQEEELFALEDEDIEVIGEDFDLAEAEEMSEAALAAADSLDAAGFGQEGEFASETPEGFNKYGDFGGQEEEAVFSEAAAESMGTDLEGPASFILDEEEHDPIYGAEESGEPVGEQQYASDQSQQGEAAGYEEADYSEYEEDYVDNQAEEEAQLLGGGQGRRFPFRAVAGLAAVLMVSAAGAVAFLKPEWLGLKVEWQAIEVVKVARPDVGVDMRPPELNPVEDPGVGQVDTPPTIDVPPLVATNPDNELPVNPPVEVPPDMGPPDAGTDPFLSLTPDLAGIDPLNPDESPAADAGPLQVGEYLQINQADSEAVIEPMVSGKRVDLASLQPGSEAFALLPNEAFFVGTVRKLNVSHVTLNVGAGEVTFAYDELVSLTTLAQAGVAINGSADAQQGFVRLNNENRLYGMIVQPDAGDKVHLESDNSRVKIPLNSVDRIGIAIQGGVEIPEEDGDAWIQEQVKKRMGTSAGQKKRFQPGVSLPKPGGK